MNKLPISIKSKGSIKRAKIINTKSIGTKSVLQANGNIEDLEFKDNVHSTKNPSSALRDKKWYEKPFGIVLLMVIAGLIVWVLTHYFL